MAQWLSVFGLGDPPSKWAQRTAAQLSNICRLGFIFAIASLALACLQTAAAASQGYVRFCTYAAKETEVQLRAANLEQ